MRAFSLLTLAFLLAVPLASGCGPSVSEEELGEVVSGIPKVPGADEPYPLPESKAPPPKGAEGFMEP